MNSEMCISCANCVAECPMDAILEDGKGKYIIISDLFTDCGSCGAFNQSLEQTGRNWRVFRKVLMIIEKLIARCSSQTFTYKSNLDIKTF